MDLLTSFISQIVCYITYGVCLMRNALVEIANEILAILGFIASLLSFILPSMPSLQFPQEINDYLGYINWIIPLGTLTTIWTYAIGAFAIYRVIKWWANKRGGILPRSA